MPCVFRNGRIIRCAEGNCVSHCVQKTILHPVLIGIVYEHVEGLAGGLHVHACQSHSSPRLIAESPFVDPPAVDGRQAIDDASTDCEFRVGGQFRETNRGYGKLFRHPTAVRRGVGGFRVAKHLHLPVTLDKQAETAGWKRDDAHVGERTERFWDGLIRRRVVLLSTAGELDVAVDRDDATDATQSEVVVRIRRLPLLGYGKLADWVCDGSGALLATACRTEVSNSDDTVRLNNQHSRGLTVGHAAHAVDFNRRPILSRQNVLALFRIPTASTNRAAELHEYQRSGFNDGEPFAVVQGYGMLLKMDFHDSTCDSNFRTNEQIDCPIRCNRYLDRTLQV